ncbi:MAG TPA: TonB-dependent receptor plug domain-containing protein [Flavisolibacter sp.]|nr:TonB-dependent receptor plug domain-containing protein [Flavisolibacter sp.]
MKRIAVLICSGFYLSLSAQQTDTTELLPVEVRATRATATAPFAKTNINKAQVQRQNLGQDLPYLLNQTPSVVVNSDAGNGVGYTGIRIRGTDATRINVTLNGIPYNDAESQGTFFVDLPDFASSVNSIQVQRGVGTSTNGAGAFGATINISTNEVNKKAYTEINNSYGSFNTLKNTIKAGTGLLNDHFLADIRLSNITSDGYIDRATSDLKALYFSMAYTSDKTDVRLNIFSGKEKTYQAWNGVSEADLKISRTINYAGMEKPGDPYHNETDNYRQDHYQLFFTQRFTPTLSFNTAVFLTKGKGYYENYKAGEDYADYGMPYPAGFTTTDLVRQRWLDNDFYGNIFSLQHQTNKSLIVLGGAFTRYDGNHFGKVPWAEHGVTSTNNWYDVDALKNDWNIYGKWQQNLTNELQVFTDMQFRKVGHNINGFRERPDLFIDADFNFFNPKIGLSYIKNNWLFYTSYSIAHKEPNRDDFEAGIVEQPKPERLNDLEIGFENKNAGRLFGLNFYFMDYKDQLLLTGKINDVGAYTRTNIPESYRVGVEIQGSAVLNKWLKTSANLTLSKNRIKNFTEFVDAYDVDFNWAGQKTTTYDQSPISFSPDVIGAATVTLTPFKAVAVELLSKYVGKQYLDNTGNDQRKLKPFFTQDVRAIYSFNYAWLKNVDFVFQVNNVFNKLYEPNGYTFSYYYDEQLTTENYYFPMAGTNWFAGINIKL